MMISNLQSINKFTEENKYNIYIYILFIFINL